VFTFFAACTNASAETLIAWNNLGMHCLDADYAVFSLLPPYNTVHAQLIDSTGRLVSDDAGWRVTYEAIADPTGSINLLLSIKRMPATNRCENGSRV
jgi:hypothetical protein